MKRSIEKLLNTYMEDVYNKVTDDGEIIDFFDGSDDIGLRQRLFVAY